MSTDLQKHHTNCYAMQIPERPSTIAPKQKHLLEQDAKVSRGIPVHLVTQARHSWIVKTVKLLFVCTNSSSAC